jgi:predicted O-methyltransferase YrrM
MHKLKKIIQRIPGFYRGYSYIRNALKINYKKKSPFLIYPPGHYYSPIPDLDEILKKENFVFGQILKNEKVDPPPEQKTCPGVDLRENAQIELLNELAVYYDDLAFPEKPNGITRYYFENSYFSYADAIVLYSILRHFKPKNVIEIGSGFSSAVMLDTNETCLDGSTFFTFIEPFPDRLNGLLKEEDKDHCKIVVKKIQEIEIELFDTLNANDILFVDSSHILKFDSDVTRIFFEILPRLKEGVIVHFHDILWPFEYPKEWLINGTAWNEAYFIRGFLQYNNLFEILYFNSFMGLFQREKLIEKMPLCLRDSGGSIWLKKRKNHTLNQT